jgi:hypothetical protein
MVNLKYLTSLIIRVIYERAFCFFFFIEAKGEKYMNISETQKVKVFKVNEHEKRKNTMQVHISSYEGKDKNGEALYSSWFANFVGTAYTKAKELLKEGDYIQLTNGKIENIYNKEKGKTFLEVIVFDFDILPEKDGNN